MKRMSKIVVSSFVASLCGATISFVKNVFPCVNSYFSNSDETKGLNHLECAEKAFYDSALGLIEGAVIGLVTASTYDYLSHTSDNYILPSGRTLPFHGHGD